MGILANIKEGYRAVKWLLDDSSQQELAQSLYDGEGLQGAYSVGVDLATWRHPLKFRKLKKENRAAWDVYSQKYPGCVDGLLPLPRSIGFLCQLRGAEGDYTPGSIREAKGLEEVMVSHSPIEPEHKRTHIQYSSAKMEKGMPYEYWLDGVIRGIGHEHSVKDLNSSSTLDTGEEVVSSQFFDWTRDTWRKTYHAVDPETEHVRLLGVDIEGNGGRARRKPTMDRIAEERRTATRNENRSQRQGVFTRIKEGFLQAYGKAHKKHRASPVRRHAYA